MNYGTGYFPLMLAAGAFGGDGEATSRCCRIRTALPTLGAGSHLLSAFYYSANQNGVSQALTQTVSQPVMQVMDPAPMTITLTSSPNPSNFYQSKPETQSQISCRSAAAGSWRSVNSLPQASRARAEVDR